MGTTQNLEFHSVALQQSIRRKDPEEQEEREREREREREKEKKGIEKVRRRADDGNGWLF
jgi:hypothetical protein